VNAGRVVKQLQFELRLFVWAVCSATGETEELITPWVNKKIMKHYLEQITACTQLGRHAVVIMDGAGWHTDDIAQGINNLTIIKLPPYSPKLNPLI
jgi:transposase